MQGNDKEKRFCRWQKILMVPLLNHELNYANSAHSGSLYSVTQRLYISHVGDPERTARPGVGNVSCYQRQTYRLGCAGRRSRWLAFYRTPEHSRFASRLPILNQIAVINGLARRVADIVRIIKPDLCMPIHRHSMRFPL